MGRLPAPLLAAPAAPQPPAAPGHRRRPCCALLRAPSVAAVAFWLLPGPGLRPLLARRFPGNAARLCSPVPDEGAVPRPRPAWKTVPSAPALCAAAPCPGRRAGAGAARRGVFLQTCTRSGRRRAPWRRPFRRQRGPGLGRGSAGAPAATVEAERVEKGRPPVTMGCGPRRRRHCSVSQAGPVEIMFFVCAQSLGALLPAADESACGPRRSPRPPCCFPCPVALC